MAEKKKKTIKAGKYIKVTDDRTGIELYECREKCGIRWNPELQPKGYEKVCPNCQREK